MGDSRIKDVSALLSAFFDEEKLRQGGQYAQVFRGWKRIAGERLAAHSRVCDIEKGILVVEAEHPGWIQLLQFRQAQMLEEARAQFPELGIRGISFRLGAGVDGAAGPQAGESRPGPFGPGGREPAEGPAASTAADGGGPRAGEPASLDDIGDPKLRSLLGALKKTVDGGK
jgi:hypothetical protein